MNNNFLNYEYDYPAWKAPLKWQQLTELFKNAFNCYYDLYFSAIDEAWHLRIEHISFYRNGMSYTASNIGIVDLSQLYDGFNTKQLSFRTNRWKYDTASQANRYEFGWMDTQSNLFEGKPLVVADGYSLFDNDKKEDLKISWFSVDIDFMAAVVEECSNDGFMLMRCAATGRVDYAATQATRYAQNYYLSFTYLISAFHLYDKYAEYMRFEDDSELLAVIDRKPMRLAEDVKFKVPTNFELKPMLLVQTEAGIGKIEEITIDMTDNSCSATLRYNTI